MIQFVVGMIRDQSIKSLLFPFIDRAFVDPCDFQKILILFMIKSKIICLKIVAFQYIIASLTHFVCVNLLNGENYPDFNFQLSSVYVGVELSKVARTGNHRA